MNPLVNKMAPKFQKFTQQMLNNVEFYVKYRITNITQIYALLCVKFPDYLIFKKDLYNATQKFKIGQKDTIKNDAINLLYNLYDRKQQDPEWFFEF
jgi:predicted Zn-dependent protease